MSGSCSDIWRRASRSEPAVATVNPSFAINMAIVDGKAVYLALTGSTPERTRGLGVEDEDAALYFTDYYENLWHAATDLGEWLAGDSREG